MIHKLRAAFVAALSIAALCSTPPAAQAASFAPANGKLLLIGQSNRAGWDNWLSIGQEPNGGSVYYELKSAAFNTGKGGVPIHQQYADLVSSKPGKFIEVGISWKDNPPGWNGDNAQKEQASKNATQALANGSYLNQFDNLINYINSRSGTVFMLRLDYEVSSAFHCTDASCNSYKGAFNRIADYIRGRVSRGNVAFVYHPVRGEYAQLYPGDANVDWIGLSVFNHELCMPIHHQGQMLYNGTPGVGFDVGANQCKGYILRDVGGGNMNAFAQGFDYDMNVLQMVKFSKDHGKPMIYSESSPMNFVAGQNGNGTDSDAMAATWAQRYFGLMNYRGPLANRAGTYDLSGVVKAVVYMNLDLRYGWDGYYGQTDGFAFPYDDMWFNNVQLPLYNAYRTTFCRGLSEQGFLAQCGSGNGGGGGGDDGGGGNGGGDGGGGNGGGSVVLPGLVSGVAFTGSQSFQVHVNSAGAYSFAVSYSASANSRLISIDFNGATANAAVSAGSGTVRTVDFNGLAPGTRTLTVRAEAGVTVTKVEAFKR